MENITPFLVDPETEPHIVIQDDRTVVVPEELKEIAVQYDHNIETVYFDCPRYWDGNDMSEMTIRINYERADGYGDSYQCKNVTVDDSDDSIMHFEWQISRNVSEGPGTLKFTACAIKTDASAIGNELLHWSSKICSDVKVLPGLDFEEHILSQHPDIIASAQEVTQKAIEATEKTNQQYEDMKKQAALIGDGNVGTAIGAESTVPAVDGAGIIRKFPGKTYQVKTNGYQLFDASKLPTKSACGATVTNNGDGSFTISGSGNIDGYFLVEHNLSTEETKRILRSGEITLKCEKTTRPHLIVKIISETNGLTEELNNYEKETTTLNIDESWLLYEDIKMQYLFFESEGIKISEGVIKPMLYQSGNGTWEPYTGGKPGPNPEYPLNVHGVGDSEDGKYAAVVKSHTLQLFDASKLPTKSACGATVTNNGDGSFTISGSGNIDGYFLVEHNLSTEETKRILRSGEITLKCEKTTRPHLIVKIISETNGLTEELNNYEKETTTLNIDESWLLYEDIKMQYLFYESEGIKISEGVIKPMLYQSGNGTWQRFASSEARIPLSQPMYDGDYAYIKDGEQVVHRKKGVAVFDGSADENWGLNKQVNGKNQFLIERAFGSALPNGTLNYKSGGIASNIGVGEEASYIDSHTGVWIDQGVNLVLNINSSTVEYSVSALKTWLQSNPITVVYDLATPVEEKITSAEPYTLRTYTPQTRIWTPDELKPDIEVDIPKNLAGGYATDGYAQAMKNQAVTAEQEAIKARLLSLEQLAIKEV